jgi:hypothetical protein
MTPTILTGKKVDISLLCVGNSVCVEFLGGRTPFTVTIGTWSQTQRSRTFAFMGVGKGVHTVHAVDGSGLVVEKEAVVK